MDSTFKIELIFRIKDILRGNCSSGLLMVKVFTNGGTPELGVCSSRTLQMGSQVWLDQEPGTTNPSLHDPGFPVTMVVLISCSFLQMVTNKAEQRSVSAFSSMLYVDVVRKTSLKSDSFPPFSMTKDLTERR